HSIHTYLLHSFPTRRSSDLSVRGTMGVQSPTGFELLKDDKNVQNHWARRLIAFIIDAVIVTVVLAIIAIAVSIRFIIGLSLPSTDRKSTRLNSSHLVISYAV